MEQYLRKPPSYGNRHTVCEMAGEAPGHSAASPQELKTVGATPGAGKALGFGIRTHNPCRIQGWQGKGAAQSRSYKRGSSPANARQALKSPGLSRCSLGR